MPSNATIGAKGTQSDNRTRPTSLEQLDSVLKIVNVRDRIFISVLFLFIASVTLFSFIYESPVKVTGRGLIMGETHEEKPSDQDDSDPLLQVTSPSSGRVESVAVKIGDTVHKGQILGRVSQRELADQIKALQSEIQRLKKEDSDFREFDRKEAETRNKAFDTLTGKLKETLEIDSRRLRVSQQIEKSDISLLSRGHTTYIERLKSTSEAAAIQSAIASTEIRLKELDYTKIEDTQKREREQKKRTHIIASERQRSKILKDQLDRDTKIVSTYEGKVLELMITPHALIEKGAPAALLQPLAEERPREATVFVPAGLGKKIREGDRVEISPDTIRRHEHGYIIGRIKSISRIPATEAAMIADLKHKTLVTSFLSQYSGQVLLRIRVTLTEKADLDTDGLRDQLKNTLEWSSKSGAQQELTNGTLCSASFVVDKRPLATLAIPMLKDLLKID